MDDKNIESLRKYSLEDWIQLSALKEFLLNSEINDIRIPASKKYSTSVIIDITIYLTQEYFGKIEDIYKDLSQAPQDTKVKNEFSFEIDKNSGFTTDQSASDNIVISSTMRIISISDDPAPLKYEDYLAKSSDWREKLIENFLKGVSSLVGNYLKNVLTARISIDIENITDPSLHDSTWKDGILISYTIDIPKKDLKSVDFDEASFLRDLKEKLSVKNGILPDTKIRVDIYTLGCCKSGFLYQNIRFQDSVKSVVVNVDANLTLFKSEPKIYRINYQYNTEKIKKSEKNIYSKAHINKIHERIYEILNQTLKDSPPIPELSKYLTFNFTIDLSLALNFGPESYRFDSKRKLGGSHFVTVDKNAKSGAFLYLTKGGESDDNTANPRFNMVVKLRVKDQLLDNDFEIVKKTFLEKIEQITHESGLSRLVNANELLAVFEYDDDQDPTDAQPKTSSKRGRKLVGIYSVVLKRDYISKDRQPITILKRLITDVKKHFTRNEDSKDGESLLQGVDITLPGVNLDIEESNDKSIIKSEFGGKGLVMDTYKFEGRSFENANEKDTDFESR
ncbi:uncharacterized protein LOC135930100 [Gordionus sp. m RMFG-2023]|uniref:uncharacterized protein LOC135930100 n=1 Tax=Gordionus sp. m RMFG-2023 TaxID=3053472 RepID=UPI0031FCC5BE